MQVHQGEIIEKIIRREGHSLTELAKLTGVNRRSIYNWFLQKRLKPESIIKIGRAIKHDFSVEFPNQFTTEDFLEVPQVADQQTEVFDIWKEKYIDLLERYNLLLRISSGELVLPKLERTVNVRFENAKREEYDLQLNESPSESFLDSCRKAGYKIKAINRQALEV